VSSTSLRSERLLGLHAIYGMAMLSAILAPPKANSLSSFPMSGGFLAGRYADPDNTLLAKRRENRLWFLDRDEVEATNKLAERELRPTGVTRKLSVGNRPQSGQRRKPCWPASCGHAAATRLRTSSGSLASCYIRAGPRHPALAHTTQTPSRRPSMTTPIRRVYRSVADLRPLGQSGSWWTTTIWCFLSILRPIARTSTSASSSIGSPPSCPTTPCSTAAG
jgi:hypothetical protein